AEPARTSLESRVPGWSGRLRYWSASPASRSSATASRQRHQRGHDSVLLILGDSAPSPGPHGSADTSSRAAIPPPCQPPSEPVWNVVPDNERDGRKHKVGCAARWPAPGIAGVR